MRGDLTNTILWPALGLLLAFGAPLAVPGTAGAQINPGGRALYGQVQLQRGFMPDPRILSGNAGGPIEARSFNPSCRGYVTSQPSHVIRSPSGFANLRIVVRSNPTDTTLMVMLPNGQVLCDDDGGEGFNPLVTLSSPGGPIRIWVGTYSSSGVGGAYTIGFTEYGHVTASSLGAPSGPVLPPVMGGGTPGGLNGMAPAMFGTMSLSRGFMPDPAIAQGSVAGGPIRGSSVQSGCRGHYQPNPSHVIQSGTGFSSLRLLVRASVDTTLLVQLPNGQILCDDDGGSGLNPLITASSPPGAIRVWVGAYSSSGSGAYTFGVSELGSVTTERLPMPGGGPGVVVRPPTRPPVVVPPQPQDIVRMQIRIPVTLFGPGMPGGTVAVWQPRGGPEVQVTLAGRRLMVMGQVIETVPPVLRDPIITVTQQRDGRMVVLAEQPPNAGDAGQRFALRVSWSGRPVIDDRWAGTFQQRPPRWAR
jgi:hypothetical protein